jgi:hypothetical protein
MALTVQLLCTSEFDGIHQIGSLPAHIVVTSYDASDGTNPVACGATSFTVYDGDGTQVATGTITSSAGTFNVSNTTSWIGGSTIDVGWYQIVTNNSSSSSCYVMVQPLDPLGAATNLVTAGNLPKLLNTSGASVSVSMSGWAPGAANRDVYSIPLISPSDIVANIGMDPYFTTGGTSARPHDVWIASSDQSATSPTTTQWAAIATALVAASHSGAVYEIPTNEPENAGENNAAIIAQANAARSAIHAVDSTARFAVFCSAGVNSTPFSDYATILAGLTFTPDFFSTHMEDDIQNIADAVSLRAYFDALKAISTASNNQKWWFTETGINEAGFGVFNTHRGARQRVMFQMIAEQYGWAKEHCYDFPQYDHQTPSGIGTYEVESQPFGTGNGNVRPGIYALHVMGEALYPTTTSPAILDFGNPVGNAMFVGSHYTGTSWDCVMLMGNGVVGATVTLAVPSALIGSPLTVWNGWGRSSTVTVDSSAHVAVPATGLATYLFLPASTSPVTVVDTDQGVIGMNSATNKIAGKTTTNTIGGAAITLPNDSFESNYSSVGSSVPFLDGVTSAGAGSNGVNVSTFTGTQSMNVDAAASFPSSGTLTCTTIGGTGTASISYSGKDATNFHNCTTLSGSGVLSTDLAIIINPSNVGDTFTTTGITGTVGSFAFRSAQPTYFSGDLALGQAPAAPTAFTVSINGSTVFTYSNATAVNHANRPTGDSTVGDAPATSTEYWDEAWSWVQQITPVTVTGNIALNVSATSFGGTIANSDSGFVVQTITISEWQVFAGTSSPGTGTPPTLIFWFGA